MREYIKTRREKPYPAPESEREELQNILWSIGVGVPYAAATNPHHMFYIELSQLRDIVQAQMDKVANEPEFSKGHITEQAREGFRQYLAWRDRRNMGVVSYAVPGIPGSGPLW